VQDKIVRLIAQVNQGPSMDSRISESSHLVDNVGLDSLQLINLVLPVERKFSIEIDFDSFNIEHLSSLDRFVGYPADLPHR
jgi:acyl carrier protein